jgi:hypothetical protein
LRFLALFPCEKFRRGKVSNRISNARLFLIEEIEYILFVLIVETKVCDDITV